jgi:NMD protein affecting ribosome stability and mRNA decay
MLLIHTCPKCGIEHELECTPEPDKLCRKCLTLLNQENSAENK